MRINQRQFRNNIFETLSDIKAIDNGNENTIGFCKETDMFYKWEDNGGSLTPDDYLILSTGKGGSTRWIQITVSKDYVDDIVDGFYFEFDSEDWETYAGTSLKYIQIIHNLDTIKPCVVVYENNVQVNVHEIEIINNNIINLYITDTEEFSGYLSIKI